MQKKVYNVPAILKTVDEKFADATARGKTYTKLSVTKDKIIEMRGWEPASKLILPNFDRILAEHRVTYVPKQVIPGPMVLFPIRDVDGEYKYAQTKPMEGSEVWSDERKYRYIGTEPFGPRWLGNDPATLQTILKRKVVAVVEGPFDWLACVLVAPTVPTLCPLTKTLGPKHIAYLRMLGVEKLVFMFDNEASEKGQKAMAYQSRQIQQIPGIQTSVKNVGAARGGGDPSHCLTSSEGARRLKEQLEACFFLR